MLHIPRNLLARREPDARFVLHVPDQRIEMDDARAHPDNVRVQREDQQRPFLVRHVELVAEGLEDQLGRGQQPWARAAGRQEPEVVDLCVHRQFDDAGRLALQHDLVGPVHGLQRAVVKDPRLA